MNPEETVIPADFVRRCIGGWASPATGVTHAHVRTNPSPPVSGTDTSLVQNVGAVRLLFTVSGANKLQIWTTGPIVANNVSWTTGSYYLAFVPSPSIALPGSTNGSFFYTRFTSTTSGTNSVLTFAYPNNLIVEI